MIGSSSRKGERGVFSGQIAECHVPGSGMHLRYIGSPERFGMGRGVLTSSCLRSMSLRVYELARRKERLEAEVQKVTICSAKRKRAWTLRPTEMASGGWTGETCSCI